MDYNDNSSLRNSYRKKSFKKKKKSNPQKKRLNLEIKASIKYTTESQRFSFGLSLNYFLNQCLTNMNQISILASWSKFFYFTE